MARIQGITIELGADASGIEQALKDVNKASSATTKELGQINKALKFDPDNVNLLSQKFDVLQDSIRNTETKLSALREAQAEVNRQFQAGEIDASAYRAFQREIEQTEGKLRSFRQQADNVQLKIEAQADTSGIEKMKTAMKELGPAAKKAASEIGSALSTAAAAGTAAVTGLVVGMADTNKDLAMLETQIGQVGLALEDIGNARTTFDSVGQQTDQVTEAMGNLIQAGYQTKDSIDDISSSLAGAIVKYGDTFNVEGLAESITTTTQLGEVTGQLTDLLEKEGINVEQFNEKIQSMSTEQERANYISQLLADQGLTSLYNKYAEGNSEIVEASAAQLSMTDALSELSTALTPLVTTVSEFVTKIVEWANENQGLATVIAVVMAAITALSGVFAVLSPIISAITALWPALAAAFGAISAPIAIAIAAVTALGVAAVALWKNWDEVSAFLQGVWQRIADTASSVFNGITDTVQRVWSAIESATSSAWNAIQNAIDSVLSAIESVISKYWSSIEDGVKKAWDGIKQYFSGVWDLIKNIFVGALLVVVQLLTGKWDEAKKSTEQIWKNIQDALKNIWEGLKKTFSGALEAIGGYIKTTWNDIKSTTSSVFNAVKSTVSSVWEGIKSTVSSVSQNILSTVKTAFTSVVSSVTDKMKEVKSTIENWWNQALSFLKSIDLSQIGRDIINGLISGIREMTGNAIEAITGVVDGIVNTAKSLLKIKSPSRVMAEIGRFVGDGLIVGMQDRGQAVTEESKKLAASITDSFTNTQKINLDDLVSLSADESVKELAKLNNEIAEYNKVIGYSDVEKRSFNARRENIEKDIGALNKKMQEYREKSLAGVDLVNESWRVADTEHSIAMLFGEDLSQYQMQLHDLNADEKAYLKKFEDVQKNKFEAQKSFVEKAKSLNVLSIKDEQEMYNEYANMYENDSEQYKFFNDKSIAIRKEVKEKLVSINNDYTSKIQAANEKLIADEKAINDAYENSVKTRAQSLYSFAGIFDEVTKKTGVSGQQLINNLRSQNDALKGFADTMSSLEARGLDAALLDELEALGPKSLGELEALNSLSDDQLNEYVALWREKSTNATAIAEQQLVDTRAKADEQIALLREETANQLALYADEWTLAIESVTGNTKTELESLVDDMPTIGANVIQGMQQGLSQMTPALVAQAQSIANAIKSTISSALDINSPSRVMRGFGVNIGQGLVLGMDDMVSKVVQTSQRLSDAASNALGSLASSSAKSQAYGANSSTSSSVDNSRHFNPSIVIHTNDSGSRVMDRTLRRLALKFN